MIIENVTINFTSTYQIGKEKPVTNTVATLAFDFVEDFAGLDALIDVIEEKVFPQLDGTLKADIRIKGIRV